MTREETRARIAELVDKFESNRDSYKNPAYNETQLRREFLDPLFEALGWDIANRAGHAEQYKDVVHEDSLRIGVSLKAPDYSFRVGGQRKFFLEAKKPSVSIKDDPAPAYQLRRYAWSAKLPVSILTDFEEFAIYDCRVRPDEKDRASTSRIRFFTIDQLKNDEFDFLYDTFSKDALYRGSFDRFIASSVGRKGTVEVDDEFLREIEGWRVLLARNVALRNEALGIDDLNWAVQQTIDRIVFLRICEDRGIEEYGGLQGLLNGTNVYKRLFDLFCRADDRYNSGLFDFKADRISSSLSIDDDVIRQIISHLYHPLSPYVFSVISADILGSVYERFLGSVIRLTAGHQAKVEEKPEVKKAGGVFYTPKYIVDYIVGNTIGRLVDGRRPVEVAKIKVLDPACGSGSFLLGAYQYLLDWHLEWYSNNSPDKCASGRDPAIYRSTDGWQLTTNEKKRILLNSIFGVDVDAQAVEVTKLSLLLKVLEGENAETIGKSLKLFKERVLPNLDENVKCGNSLVGPDFYSQLDIGLDTGKDRRMSVFDWHDVKKGFGAIMKSGGFDAVIGNPPYVRQEMIKEYKPYLQGKYKTFSGTADLYVYFFERAHGLLKQNGLFGFISSNKFMRAAYGRGLRDFLAKKTRIREIVDFGELPVFQNAATFPAIFFTENATVAKQKFRYAPIKSLSFDSLKEEVKRTGETLDSRSLDGDNWTLAAKGEIDVIEKMRQAGVPLGEYVDGKIYRGVLTGLNEAFVIDAATRKLLIAEDPKSKDIIKPFVVGDDVRKYSIGDEGRFLILMPKGWTDGNSAKNTDKWEWFSRNYPAIANHLLPFNARAKKRCDKGDYWWELRACDYYGEFEKPKIIYPDIAKESRFAFSDGSLYFSNTVYFMPVQDLYLLALLNSKLIFSYFKRNAAVLGDADKGGRLRWFRQDVSKIPIRRIDPSKKEERAVRDRIIKLVEAMISHNKRRVSVKNPVEKDRIEREMSAIDKEIDSLVYELYGLSAEEIDIVEQGRE